MRNTPMMANPFEYRETMWSVIHDGEEPRPSRRTDTSPESGRRRGHRPRALPSGAGSGLSRLDSNKLANFRDELMALRERREAERGSPPEPTPAS
jgi:hypothetical protein